MLLHLAVGAVCGIEEFRCADGSCISATLKCDGISDCNDDSDENLQAGCHSSKLNCAK